MIVYELIKLLKDLDQNDEVLFGVHQIPATYIEQLKGAVVIRSKEEIGSFARCWKPDEHF